MARGGAGTEQVGETGRKRRCPHASTQQEKPFPEIIISLNNRYCKHPKRQRAEYEQVTAVLKWAHCDGACAWLTGCAAGWRAWGGGRAPYSGCAPGACRQVRSTFGLSTCKSAFPWLLSKDNNKKYCGIPFCNQSFFLFFDKTYIFFEKQFPFSYRQSFLCECREHFWLFSLLLQLFCFCG